MNFNETSYLFLSSALFFIGLSGIFLNRKNIIILLMSIELMLLAINFNFIIFSVFIDDIFGQLFEKSFLFNSSKFNMNKQFSVIILSKFNSFSFSSNKKNFKIFKFTQCRFFFNLKLQNLNLMTQQNYNLRSLTIKPSAFLLSNNVFSLFPININQRSRFFNTTSKLQRNFLPYYLLKTSEKSQKERIDFGKKEVETISKKFSLVLAHRIPDFSQQWNFPMENKVVAFVEFPPLYDIRKAILHYPTAYLYLTQNLRISQLTYQDFNLDTDLKLLPPKHSIVLVERYHVDKLNVLLENIDIIRFYYKQLLCAWTSNGFKSINFSFLGLKAAYFGTDDYFNIFEKNLRRNIQRVKEYNDLNKTNSNDFKFFRKYMSTRPFFLTFVPLDVNRVDLNYANLPLELVAYLIADSYGIIGYKEDFFDILEQFLNLNYIKVREMDNIQFFFKHKDKLLNRWSREYGVPQEFILYCLEQYIRGKHPEFFRPYTELLAIEKIREISGPRISDIILWFKYDLLDIIFSFTYRQAPVFDVLRHGNIDLSSENQKKSHFLYFRGLNWTAYNDLIAMIKHLNLTNKDELTSDDLKKVGQIGYPLLAQEHFWNFDAIMHIVEKQIQQAFFDSLLEIYPDLRLTAAFDSRLNTAVEKNDHCFTLFYLSRENKYFFLPLDKINKDLTHVFSLLHEKVRNKTLYRLSFTNVSLINEKKFFEDNISKIRKNFLNILTKILKNEILNDKNNYINFQLFVKMFLGDLPVISRVKKDIHKEITILKTNYFEIDFSCFTTNSFQVKEDYFFSYIEIQYILETLYPTATVTEIKFMRSEIVKILKNLDFSISQHRMSVKTVPYEFYSKLISTNQYTVQSNSIRSQGFYGIRFVYSVFKIK